MKFSNIPWGTVAKVGVAVAASLGIWEGAARQHVMPQKATVEPIQETKPVTHTCNCRCLIEPVVVPLKR